MIMRVVVSSMHLLTRAMMLVALALGISGCVYAPPPAGYAYAPAPESYAYAPSYYAPGYYAPSYYYGAPGYYYPPPVFGSATFFFGGGHGHFR
jgi:hypothetical protein